MTVTVFGYLILISMDFYDLIFRFLFRFVHVIHQTLKAVLTTFPNTSRLVNTPLRVVFSTLFSGVWKCGQTLSFVFGVLHEH